MRYKSWYISLPSSSKLQLRPTLIRFQTKTELFCSGLLRIRLLSTLQRQKRSPKTEPFENAPQSGGIWKRCFLKTLFSSVDRENDAIWKRWRYQGTTGRQTTRPWASKMADRCYHVASLLIGVVVWTSENDTKTVSVDANLFENSFENGLVWTGP